jgi:uncharacterized delta-60 repeat protein
MNGGYGAAVQSTGKLIAGADCSTPTGGTDLCAIRYNLDGTVDTTFGTSGIAAHAVGPGTNLDKTKVVLVQQDDKVVVLGWCDVTHAYDFCLARFTANGVLDTTYGGGTGHARATLALEDNIQRAVQQPDGKIVVVGHCDSGAGATSIDFCAARFTTDGQLDTSFNGTGTRIINIGVTNTVERARGVALQSDGKILLTGVCSLGGPTGADGCVVRLNADGTNDNSFGTSGLATLALSPGAGTDSLWSIAQLPSGKIVTSGVCTGATTQSEFCIAQLTTNGSLDTSFNGTGYNTDPAVAGAVDDRGYDMVVQEDGRIVMGGSCNTAATASDLCFVRYLPGGTRDTTFGTGGTMVISPSGTSIDDWMNGMSEGIDGSIVFGGVCNNGAAADVCVGSFGGGPAIEQFTGTSWATPATSAFGACLHTSGGGAAPIWTPSATCPASDGGFWNAIPTSSSVIANAATGNSAATVGLRFGLHLASDQPAGSYVAPVTFDVIAPNA